MPRFYLSPTACQDSKLTLTGREAHHALRVLRLRPGDALTVLDGRGAVYHCHLVKAKRDEVDLTVSERNEVPVPSCAVTLCQALTKARSFEWLLQKVTELGVARVVPLLTAHTVPDFSPAQFASKQEKWHWIAVEALKQSGSAWLPRIETPVTLDASLLNLAELNLVGSLAPEAPHARACLLQFDERHHRSPTSVSIWIGPEGDFSATEADSFRQAGVHPITLGRQVLRSETAAIYTLAILHHELSWSEGRH